MPRRRNTKSPQSERAKRLLLEYALRSPEWVVGPDIHKKAKISTGMVGRLKNELKIPTRRSPGPDGKARVEWNLGKLWKKKADRISGLLHEASETHHVVYRIVDGDDPDWASWYADWLLNLSELPGELGGSTPVRSHLVHALVQLDRDYTAKARDESWEDWYARGLIASFGL
jgi:hypothetical protein